MNFDEASEGCRLEALGLSIRSYNGLRRAGITSVEQLKGLSIADASAIGGIGGIYLAGFLEELADCGLSLRGLPPSPNS